MIFESARMTLKVIRIVLNGDVNDIYICQDIAASAKPLYTVLVTKDHDTVHKLLTVFEKSERTISEICTDSFSLDDKFLLVFPYVKERPLDRFFTGSVYTLPQCEEICVNLVVNLMTSPLPFPLMYLMLSQHQLHISKEDNIYPGYQIDLAELDVDKTEGDCAIECARIILNILDSKEGETSPMSYDLLDMKILRKSYKRFMELYKDIRIAAAPATKRGLWRRIKAFFRRNKDRVFKILLIVSVILGLFVLISFLTNLIFGDIPWLRIFTGGFEHIGTENLVQ